MPTTILRVPNRLSARAKSRGGIAAGEAVTRAEAAVESLRAISLGIIDAQLNEIERLYGPGGSRRETGELTDLYDRALDIVESSSGLPGSGLEDAARAVCEFVALSQAAHLCDWDAVDVHVAALKVLRSEGQQLKPSQRKAILKGLQDVMQKRATGDGNA